MSSILLLCGKYVIRLKSAKNSDIILVSAKRKGDFMQFILTFSAIYILGALIGQNMRIFIREPKLIHIKSPIIYTFLRFPVCVIAGKAVLAKNQKLMLSELMCCIFNQIVLVGTVILQVIPPVPCEVIELTFGLRHQWLDIVLDTYNQKIPLVAVLALLCAEVVIIFGEFLVRCVRNADLRKKLGKGALIWIAVLCAVFIAVLIFAVSMLF